MFGYFIGFWTVFSITLIILSIFIWLCLRKSTDNRILQISFIGLEYLMTQYLYKCFQQICFLLIKNGPNDILKINKITVNEQQDKFVNQYNQLLTIKLLKFARGQEIVKGMYDCLKKNDYTQIDLFIFPDTILINLDYYKNILYLSSFSRKIQKSDQDAKNYIKDLIKYDIKIVQL